MSFNFERILENYLQPKNKEKDKNEPPPQKKEGFFLPAGIFKKQQVGLNISNLTPEELEYFDERAGIMEFDGGFSKVEAEKKALEVLEKRRIESEAYKT